MINAQTDITMLPKVKMTEMAIVLYIQLVNSRIPPPKAVVADVWMRQPVNKQNTLGNI